MKVFFGIDQTDDKDNERIDGADFIDREVNAETEKALEDNVDALDEIVEKSELALPLRIIRFICGVYAAILLAGVIRAMGELDSVAQVWKNAAWLILSGGAAAVIWAVLTVAGKVKARSIEKEDATELAVDRTQRWGASAKAELGVPENAEEIEILLSLYKRKKDKVVFKAALATFVNSSMSVFSDSENLYFADCYARYCIPMSEITEIRTVKKRVSIPSWDKDTPYNKGEYKQYRMTVNNMGFVFFKYYYALCIQRADEQYELYLPPYELPVITRLIGLQPTE